MTCFVCKRTGQRICDASEVELHCMICGFCEREAVKEAVKCTEVYRYPTTNEIKLREEMRDGY